MIYELHFKEEFSDLLSIYSVERLAFNNGNYIIQNSPVSFAQTMLTGPTSNIPTMTWGADGNVGVGTTSPFRRLSVVGSGIFTGGDVTASTFTATSSISTPSLTLSGTAINSLLGTNASGAIVATST